MDHQAIGLVLAYLPGTMPIYHCTSHKLARLVLCVKQWNHCPPQTAS